MSPTVLIRSITKINGKTLILRGTPTPTPTPTPSPFNCSLDTTITDIWTGSGFTTGFTDLGYRIHNGLGFNSNGNTAPFSVSEAYRIYSSRFNTIGGTSGITVTASVAGSPTTVANVRVWFSWSDYIASASPDYSQIINNNPMSYCFVPDSDGSAVVVDLQSVAAPGTAYSFGHMTGGISTSSSDMSVADNCFVIAGESEQFAYFTNGVESSASSCTGASTVGFSKWTATCLEDAYTWYLGWDAVNTQMIALRYGGTNCLGTTGDMTWYLLGDLPSSANWYGVVAGNSKVVAIVDASTTYAYSSNGGTTWTGSTLPVSANSINFLSGYFVVPATGTDLGYSSDGVSWSTSALGSSKTWVSCLMPSDNYYYVFASDGTILKTSTLSSSWTSVASSGKAFAKVVYGLVGSTDTFVGIISSTSISYSTDKGSTWTDVDLSGSFSNVAIQDIAFGTAVLTKYFVITNGSPSGNQIFWSTDGITWSNSYSGSNNQNNYISVAAAYF